LSRLPPEEKRRILWIWAIWSAGVLSISSLVARSSKPALDPWPAPMSAQAIPLARWDSGWYYLIAAKGYSFDPASPQNNVGFYPLYPLLCRWIATALGTSIFAAGVGLSLLCLLGGVLLFGELSAGWGEPRDARLAVLALLLYPTAFFLAACYTESLFLLSTTAAFWAAREHHWLLCGLAGAAASLTRFNGFLIVLPIAWYAWESAERRLKNVRWPPITALVLTAAGAAAFPVFLWRRWGDPFLYIHSKETGWTQKMKPVLVLVREVGQESWSHLIAPGMGRKLQFSLETGSLVLFLVLTIGLWRRRLLAEGLYCAASLLLVVNSGTLDGMQRYVLALFPGFFVLATFVMRHRLLAVSYALAGAGLGLLTLSRFVRWIFVG
jgi:Gpi18-like mannosyltransferase